MIARHLADELKKRFSQARSVYIFGPRQSGKTTLARSTFPNMRYVSLEDPDNLEFARQDTRGFLSGFSKEGIIDEPQRCPELFSYLQSEIDIEKKKFILTSSQNFLLMEKVSQSLAGRLSILNLLPLSKSEIENQPIRHFLAKIENEKSFRPISTFLDIIVTGGYPELWENPESKTYWYSDYVRTYLERDVRQILNIQDLGLFTRFLKLCAGRSGSLLNKASIASDCGISETNCTRWLSILEQSGIIFLLKPFYKNFNKRITKSPKLYFNDTGVLCHLLSIKTTDHLNTHPLYGQIVETYVVSEIRKQYENRGIESELYFWRDNRGAEIDLIVPEGNTFTPVEIKVSETAKPDQLTLLNKWATVAKSDRVIVLYGGKTYRELNQGQFIPIDSL